MMWAWVTTAVCIVMMVVNAQLQAVDPNWWKSAIIYQIYPRSFQDSNGDGIGDIQGIISRLDHFVFLGVEVIWMNPIYRSPMLDFGYDISNFTDVDPVFGTLADFDDLVSAVHARGMKLILDFVPNHTSNEHPWFIESRKGGNSNPYRDYYIWDEGRTLSDGSRKPPNNWLSCPYGSAWEWDTSRQAFYYHQHLTEQPDLNFRNPSVRQEMEDVLQFWVTRGVDGVRVDAIRALFEVEDLSMDEPPNLSPHYTQHQRDSLVPLYTEDLADVHVVTRYWRKLLDDFERQTGKHIFMAMAVSNHTSLSETMKYYHSGADFPFNLSLLGMKPESGGRWFYERISMWLNAIPVGKWPNFVLGNHGQPRISMRKGSLYADALNVLVLTLPGTPTVYQGDEIGQLDVTVTYDNAQDTQGIRAGRIHYAQFSRDGSRAPIQWNNSTSAGFSSCVETWLPVHPDFKTRNVEVQKGCHTGMSTLQIFREAAYLRRERSFKNNRIQYGVVNDNILSYIRHAHSHPAFLITMNLGQETSTDDYSQVVAKFGLKGRIEISSQGENGELSAGQHINLAERVTLSPGKVIVVRLLDPGLWTMGKRAEEDL